MADAFVHHVQVVFARGRSEVVDEPAWDAVAQILARMGAADGACRLDLLNEDESVAMTIYGEGNSFHVGIIKNETEQTYLAAGARGSGARVAIAGHSFPPHLVVHERQQVVDVTNGFWRYGTCLASSQWTDAW